MNPNNSKARPPGSAGFTLPAVLVVVAALLIMVIGLLAMSGIERKTARSYVDLQRSDMAALAGLEQVKSVLDQETANDDFVIVQNVPPLPDDGNKALETVPYLYVARGSMTGTDVKYRYLPLFSTLSQPEPSTTRLDPPDASTLVGEAPKEVKTLPWLNSARSAWVPIKAKKNGKEQTVARYAYWVEDLQGKINPKIAGNELSGTPVRSVYPFPAPGLKNPNSGETNSFPLEKDPPLNGIALYALDPNSTDIPKGDLTQKIIDGREVMVSPDSILAAAGYAPPLTRTEDGQLSDLTASALEKNLSPVIHSYDERPVIPYAQGISAQSAGQPKLNLNKLLSGSRTSAISDFANHINQALPMFAKKNGPNYDKDSRPGGFPDDYLQTLAASTFDYADTDNDPTVKLGSYRGVDAAPTISEIVLKFDYIKHEVVNGDLILTFQLRLYAELWNMTNKPISGSAQVSYEVALNRSPIGSGVKGLPFDDANLLADKTQTTPGALVLINGKYYTNPVPVATLYPDQYKFYRFADITYKLNVSPNKDVGDYSKTTFRFEELASQARGMTLRWNNQDIDRVPKILRDSGTSTDGTFTIGTYKYWAKAAIPGGSYGSFGTYYINNMGDARIANYIRDEVVSDNAYPENLSPNRRTVRRGTIYEKLGTDKFFGRTLPSEWPDRGHDAAYGIFAPINAALAQTVPDDPMFYYTVKPPDGTAPQRLSNAGRFYSATELGNIFDPVMWSMAYDDIPGKPGTGATDTKSLYLAYPVLPASRHVFPDVSDASAPSASIGGGNTLRIGRYEHQRFDKPGLRASYLLDLFHAGKALSNKVSEREGDLITIDGQVNINTASKDTLRAMAAGVLKQDPRLARVTSWAHDIRTGKLAPTQTLKDLGTPTTKAAADIVADAIILNRPYAAMGELSSIKDLNKKPVFGNPAIYTNEGDIAWTDAAAEELFDRIHDAGTFRSRNFRVWVIGQSITGPESKPEILAETRKVYTIFADPGERKNDGQIDVSKSKTRVTYENNF
jgi:hypothetical protein